MRPAEQLTLRFGVARPTVAARVEPARQLRRRVALFGLAALEGLLLGVIYAVAIVPVFGYQGFEYQNPGVAVIATSLAIAALPALVLPLRITRPSGGVLWLLFVLVVVPSAVMPHLIPIGTAADHFAWELLLVASFVVVSGATRLPLRPLPELAVLRPWATGLLLATYAVMALYMVSRMGINVTPLALADVYEVRLRMRATLAGDAVLAYLIPWFQNVVCPCLVVAGWTSGRWRYLALGIAGEIYVYQALGNRQALLAVIVIIVLLAVGPRLSPTRLVTAIAGGAVALLTALLVIDLTTASVMLTSVVGLRTFAVPGILSANYYDFFSTNPIVVLRDGLLSSFSPSPYHLPTANLISDIYYNQPTSTSNAHVWADGFANFGILGFVLVPVVLGAILWLIDSTTIGVRPHVVLAALVFLVVAWSNVGITTSFVTSGVGIMLLLLVTTEGRVLAGRQR